MRPLLAVIFALAAGLAPALAAESIGGDRSCSFIALGDSDEAFKKVYDQFQTLPVTMSGRLPPEQIEPE